MARARNVGPRNTSAASSQAAKPQPKWPRAVISEMSAGIPRSPIPLAAGRTLQVDEAGARVVIRAPEGQVELTVRMSSEGPVLCFASASLQVAQVGRLEVSVDHLALRARQGIEIESLAGVSQRIAGDQITHCEGEMRVEAGSAKIVSHKGALELDSTHDVTINGDRVLLNC